MTLEGNVNEDSLAAAVKAMEDLVDEAVQVFELDKEKTNVIDDLYNSLKIITSYLGFSVDLHPGLLGLSEHTRAVLTPSLDILIIKPNFKSEQKRFDQLTLDETSNVLRYAIPTMINMARSDRTIKNKKISYLREGTKKLKRLPSSSAEDMIVTDTSVHVEKVQ
ncbi:MAG: hypothetical protein ACREAD_05550 [Nitrosopumilaceae archaeon]